MGGIIVIGGSKGGNGKTLLASLLAPGLAQRGYRTGSLTRTRTQCSQLGMRPTPALRCAVRRRSRDVQVVDLAQAWAEELDVVVIDTAGFGNLTAAAAMGCADYVLVPCMPDRGSTREAAKTVEKVASLAKAARRAIGASVVLSQWRTGGVAEQAALEDLADYGVTPSSELRSRIARRFGK